MHWIDVGGAAPIRPDIQLALARERVQRRPNDFECFYSLGCVLMQSKKNGEAVAAFERALLLGCTGAGLFTRLAHCLDQLGRYAEALQVCDRGLAAQVAMATAQLHTCRGMSLRHLGRTVEARAEFLIAMRLDPAAYDAALPYLATYADGTDRDNLLEACDSVPKQHANSTAVRAFRALALDDADRAGEARQIVDPARHVAQFRFEPPAAFGGVATFNERLADEIRNNPGLVQEAPYNFLRTETLGLSGETAFRALTDFLRTVIETYLEELPQRGLDKVLPPPPQNGLLFAAGNVVYADIPHEPHIHKNAYVSGVYHVCVPPDDGANDRAGDLVIGTRPRGREGHEPCWGTRYVRPEPGVATIFPSHIFHGVVPTHSTKPRIAVPFDLRAAGGSQNR